MTLGAAGWFPRVRRLPEPDDASHLALLELVEQPPRQFGVELAAAIPRRRTDSRRYIPRSIPGRRAELGHRPGAKSAGECSRQCCSAAATSVKSLVPPEARTHGNPG